MSVDLDTLRPAPLDDRAASHMVVMRDGVRLATDAYLPQAGGPWPAVLVRLPYDKNGRYTFMPQLADAFTERGYVFVVQDVRGRFRSEGETLPFDHEAADGYDTLSWIVEQAWSDGTVGMFGDSYYGFTQWAAVASAHPALRAIVPRVTTAELGRWLESDVPSLYGAQYLAEVWTDNHMHTWPIDWSRRPLAEVFDPGFEAIGARSLGFERLLARSRTGEAMDPFNGDHPFGRLSIPTLHAVGWFDNLTPDSMRDYMALTSDPHRAAFQYLVADSTDHENYHLSDIPVADADDHDVSDDALVRMLPRYVGPALDFFDVFLARRAPASSMPRVRWHMGHDDWQLSPTWPPPGATEARLFLSGLSSSTESVGGGRLAWDLPSAAESVTWTHNPGDLVPSTVENPFAFLLQAPDESDVEGRSDVLTFSTEPLTEDLVLAGPVNARLRLATGGPSMDVFAKLVEVTSDDGAMMLLRGQSRLDPSGVAEVYLGHTGIRIQAGNRLRLHVASSDFPLYLPHPGTAENPWFATETEVNRQTLMTDLNDPSFLTVTVLGTASA